MGSDYVCGLLEISNNCPLDVSETHFDLRDSSFFKLPGRELPNPTTFDISAKGIKTFPEMQLVVKFGKNVNVDEAVTLWAVRKTFGHVLPVPELYGWRVHSNTVLIYMELIPGVTLRDRWSTMTTPEKDSICLELRQMLVSLRKGPSKGNFVGSITHGPLTDRIFHDRPKAGPFRTLKDFYHWLEWLPQRYLASSQRYKDPYLCLMPKDSVIKFTHADINPVNIMVSASGSPRVLALIDWEQAGWYPDYWEYYKMCYTTFSEDEWRKVFIPKIIDPWEDETYIMDEYTMTIGAI